MKRSMVFVVVLGLIGIGAANARAQSDEGMSEGWDGRVVLNLGAGYQLTSTDFTQHDSQIIFAETATTDAAMNVPSGLVLDGFVGARVFGNIGVGVGFSRFSKDTTGDLTISIPHPLFFNRNATDTAAIEGTKREETAINFDLFYLYSTDKVHVMVFGGGSYFKVKQDLPEDFRATVTLFTNLNWTANITRVDVRNVEESKMGFNAGVDFAYFFTKNIGIGAQAKIAKASVDLPNLFRETRSASPEVISVDAGGFQATGGLRIRF